MLSRTLPSLSGWETFYVITGSAGAALTGLMFVVIALAADRGTAQGGGVKAFGTPTVVHFCAVLLVAAVLTTPDHTIWSLSFCLGAIGVAGLVYKRWNWIQVRKQKDYTPVRSDWIWFLILPSVSYATVLIAAMILLVHPVGALYVVAAAVMLLLYSGIHNAWDAALYIGFDRPSAGGSP